MKNYFKSAWSFLVKWTCATNRTKSGTYCILLGGFLGIVVAVLSVAIRFKLAHEYGLVFKGNAIVMAFLYKLHTEDSQVLLSSIRLTGDTPVLILHIVGFMFIIGIANTVFTIIRALSAAALRVMLFARVILMALATSFFFVSPAHNPIRQIHTRNKPVKCFPPIIVGFGLTYIAGKALDATGRSIYETSSANYSLWKSQTPVQRAEHKADVIARRILEEPLSPTEGIRGEQRSSMFIDGILSSPNFGTFVGVFTFSIFLVALSLSLYRLYVARQLRIKGISYSKELTDNNTKTTDALSIGLLTAAVSVPLARAMQHFARLAALGPDSGTDIFGYGIVIYDFVNTDAFFSIFTIGCAAGVSITVWYLQRTK